MSIPAVFISIAILSCVMSVAVLGSLYQAHVPGVRLWSVASALLAVTSALLLSGTSDIVVATSSSLLMIASLLGVQGFRQFLNTRPDYAWEYVAIAAILGLLMYWTFVSPHVDARSAMISGVIAYVRFNIGWMVLRHRPPGRPKYAYYFVSVAATLGAVVHGVRSIAYALGLVHETVFLEPTPLNVLFLGMATLTLPSLSVGMVLLAHDRLADRMERLATYDDLTGVLARRAFIARAETVAMQSEIGRTPLSVAILDIDNFKSVNDRYGHAAGDCALAHVASLISRSIRADDVVGRIGGEEFALLLPHVTKEEAGRLVDRLRDIVATSGSCIPSRDVVPTLSAGVDAFGRGDTLATVMARADAALYAAKANGRNCVVVVPDTEVRPAEGWDRRTGAGKAAAG
ncbi:GGDEF domain-containing protein [Pandoraea sputorum]|uniref:diguanylate cyclase n=1 Tax=Pandoraea sputorum TaxID=93222 RepID=A0A239SI96_9BURK|nr:sensor domain-containing diguanylate cyclase [Pandoraea sputorum]APD12434.1 diguanylate cyclase [Pandoraea sputorum]SNU85185.1 Probable diguanylate cyclase YcdT [Pandoraea sputorum]VVD83671.1 diguanylate cyclase [Pandoraea sputorum]